MDEIEEIWKRLVEAYGDTKMLLTKRLSQVEVMTNFSKTKVASKVAESLLINTMKGLTKTAVLWRWNKQNIQVVRRDTYDTLVESF